MVHNHDSALHRPQALLPLPDRALPVPRECLETLSVNIRMVRIDRYQAFGTAGNASKITATSLEDMFGQYASGALDPVVN